MPNIKSAKKRVNVIKRQTEENIPVRGSMRTAVKKAVKDSSNQALVNDAVKKIVNNLKHDKNKSILNIYWIHSPLWARVCSEFSS